MKNKDQYIRLRNIILYILNSFSNGTDYIKLYKILYFANKEQLAEVGVPVVSDNFKAWDFGPVPSFTGSVVKHLEADEDLMGEMRYFDGAIKVQHNQRVSALMKPDVDSIPEFTRNLLDNIIKKYKNRNSKQMSKESHDDAWFEAYETKGGKNNGTVIIDPVSIAKAGGAEEDILRLVQHVYSHNDEYLSVDEKPEIQNKVEETSFEINHLMRMTEGWDGDDADSIERLSAMNCREILARRNARTEYVDVIYPTPSGSICVDWKNNGAKVSLELCNSKLAFYYVSANKDEIFDSPMLEFNDDSLAHLFHYINKID